MELYEYAHLSSKVEFLIIRALKTTYGTKNHNSSLNSTHFAGSLSFIVDKHLTMPLAKSTSRLRQYRHYIHALFMSSLTTVFFYYNLLTKLPPEGYSVRRIVVKASNKSLHHS